MKGVLKRSKSQNNNSLLSHKEAALKEKNITAFQTYFPNYQNETLDSCFRCYYLNLLDGSISLSKKNRGILLVTDYHLFLHIIGIRNGDFKLVIPWSSIESMKLTRKRSKVYRHKSIEIVWKDKEERIVSNFISFTNIIVAFQYLSQTLSTFHPNITILEEVDETDDCDDIIDDFYMF